MSGQAGDRRTQGRPVLYPDPVTRVIGRRIAAATGAVALVALAGCSGGEPDARPTSESSSPATASQTPSPSPSPSEVGSEVPAPGSMETPGTTSGRLSVKSFPTPKQLGAGWKYAVDPGDAEEGYSGNGTSALARSPQEIVQTALPFGCERSGSLPQPTHALEVDYTVGDVRVIAVRGQFDDAGVATAFYDGRATGLRACEGKIGSPAIGALVTAISTPAPNALASYRTPKSDPWREIAVLDGDTVVMVAVQGRDTLNQSQERKLVKLLHR